MRGYSAVGLISPKFDCNVGGAMRACHCYDASLVLYQGSRITKPPTDTHGTWRSVPTVHVDDVLDSIPYDCIPVAVDLVDHAISLIEYQHPHRALYIFGPEDGTLGGRVTDRCRDIVYVPTNLCMNLAATVNVVLYDRLAKRS